MLSHNPGIVDVGLTPAGMQFVGNTDHPWLDRLGCWAAKARDSGDFVPLDIVVRFVRWRETTLMY